MATLSELRQLLGLASSNLVVTHANTTPRSALNDNLLLDAASGTGAIDLYAVPGGGQSHFRDFTATILPTGTITGGTILAEGSDTSSFQSTTTLNFRLNGSLTSSGALPTAGLTVATVMKVLNPDNFRYVRLRISGSIAGTAAGVRVSTVHYHPPNAFSQLNINTIASVLGVTSVSSIIGGAISHSSADSGNPHKIGGRVRTTADTTLLNGDRSDAGMTTNGMLLTYPFAPPENVFQVTGGANTSTTIVAAPAAGLRNYITHIYVTNNGAANQFVNVISGGNILWSSIQNTNGSQLTLPVGQAFTLPLRGDVATAITLGVSSSTQYSIGGFVAP